MRAWVVLCVLGLVACGTDDPEEKELTPSKGTVEGTACVPPPAFEEDLLACMPSSTDYTPRVSNSSTDTWASCISDAGDYERLHESVSTIARVTAYESIADLLWRRSSPPEAEDFLDARVIFEAEQGLGSRVSRRYDVRYAPPASGDCTTSDNVAAYPDYCVGPATLQPIIVEAFAQGALGNDRVENAARVHAALQWFFYASTVKEATTCTTTLADCDSSWAYYSGGTARDAPLGFGAEIYALSPETHQRAYDGILAVRCWRDLDDAVPAADLELRDRAIAQLDKAQTRGMALLIRQYFAQLDCTTGDYAAAAHEALKILVSLFDTQVRNLSATAANTLAAEVSKTTDAIDVEAALSALDSTFDCP